MNKQTISKILDILAMIAIFVVFILYLFFKTKPIYVTIELLGVGIIKMLASMLRASYYEKENENLRKERDFLIEKSAGLEMEI